MRDPLLSPVTVPFCCLPGSLTQTFEPATCLRSAFQVAFLARVAAKPDFAYFVTMLDVGGQVIMAPEYHAPISVMWYTIDGQCHAAYVGVNRLLHEVHPVGPGRDPVPLDHPVYQSRCAKLA